MILFFTCFAGCVDTSMSVKSSMFSDSLEKDVLIFFSFFSKPGPSSSRLGCMAEVIQTK